MSEEQEKDQETTEAATPAEDERVGRRRFPIRLLRAWEVHGPETFETIEAAERHIREHCEEGRPILLARVIGARVVPSRKLAEVDWEKNGG
jgi:hypothetical protein